MSNNGNGAAPADRDATKIKSDYAKLVAFLEESKIVFDQAILTTPTGEARDQLCDLNIRRMEFISKGFATALHSARLYAALGRLVESENALSEMSCDDSRLGDATFERNNLIEELVEIVQE